MPSFDVVCKADLVEVKNAVEQANKEIGTRFDFKGSDSRVEEGKKEKIGGDKLKQVLEIKNGVAGDLGKRIVKIVKDSKMKVQASIQGDTVRITGGKRDDLQTAIALLRKEVTDVPLNYENFRD